MIFPCIDIMDGKAVQLVQGRDKALEAEAPEEMLRKFAAFPQIQVIDLDAAMGRGSNDGLVRVLASKAAIRAGGGVRTVERARALVEQGVRKVIVGTSAFSESGINHEFLQALRDGIGRDRLIVALDSKYGRIVVKGWREATALTAEEVLGPLEPTAAGGVTSMEDVRALLAMNVHVAIGMAMYTGRLKLEDLAPASVAQE